MRRDALMGDAAVLVRTGDHGAAGALAGRVEAAAWAGVEDVVAGAGSVLVVVDPALADVASLGEAVAAMAEAAEREPPRPRTVPATHHDIPVAFDGEDREEVAAAAGCDADALAARLTASTLDVAFVGFVPGFAYLSGLSPGLAAVPRRRRPRPRVPAGSVAIGGGHAGVYPLPTPGGWQLVGRTDYALLDVAAPPYARLSPGDTVRFHRADDVGPAPIPERAPHRASGRRVVVLDAGSLTTVQDAGRTGVASAGIPRAGAADPFSYRVANLAAGNDAEAAALEITMGGLQLRFETDAAVALAGDAALRIEGHDLPNTSVQPVARGQVLSVGALRSGARAYLAIAGGLQTQRLFASRAADTVSGIGPPPLRAGDELALGEPGRPRGRIHQRPRTGHALLRVIPGPDLPAAASRLAAGEWRVDPESDRAGVRLRGDTIAAGGGVPSHGVVAGAVQLPPGGDPVVLGVDHGTLGGYAVVATVITADLAVLGQLRPGEAVRFELVGLDDARRARNAAAQSAAASTSAWYPDVYQR